MTEIFSHAAIWLGLAVLATILANHLRRRDCQRRHSDYYRERRLSSTPPVAATSDRERGSNATRRFRPAGINEFFGQSRGRVTVLPSLARKREYYKCFTPKGALSGLESVR